MRAQSTDGLGMPRPDQPPPGAEVEAKKLTKLPKQTKFVEAEYPKDAVEKNIETDVVLMLDINAEGKVDQVSIVTPAPAEGYGFDEAALIAAHEFEFEPAEMDGKKIPVQITYKYKFRLAPKKSPARRRAAASPRQAARRLRVTRAPRLARPRPSSRPRHPWRTSAGCCASGARACRWRALS